MVRPVKVPAVMLLAFRFVTLTFEASSVPVVMLLPLITVPPAEDKSVNDTKPLNVICSLDKIVSPALRVNVLLVLPLETDREILSTARPMAACICVVVE